MDLELETPREAALKAENARLRAENEYLRRAVNAEPGTMFTPIAAVQERAIGRPLPDKLTLPTLASVEGALARDGNYHVIGRLSHWQAQPEDLVVRYYADGFKIKGQADYFVNEMFPYLHQRFIAALANAIHKPRREVA